ncbi:hypothetical protein VaNZ11_005290 [Volvox africanus]|uniref:F-box domain-containing protein n=1 Tax=Volvox africanus TaxID=51714 RepID=A0ABQ5RYD0_9CHLO|nr:hypothetical protein VaNZ11_005290 [Volvox africanus]
MGEAGSHGANAGPSQPPSCESESATSLLSLPMEILLLIIEYLPRRCFKNVRLVCRKLEAAAEVTMNRICIWLEGQPRVPETHHLLCCDRLCLGQNVEAGSASQASLLNARVQRALTPTGDNVPPVAPPGWASYVKELQLCLRIEPTPDEEPHPGQRQSSRALSQGQGDVLADMDMQLDMAAAGAPAVAAPGALQGLPANMHMEMELAGPNIIVHAQHVGLPLGAGPGPGQPQPAGPAAPQQEQQPLPAVMALAQQIAGQVHGLLQLAAQGPGNLAGGQQPQIDAVLPAALVAVLPMLNAPQAAEQQQQQQPPLPPQQQQLEDMALVMEVAQEHGPAAMPPPPSSPPDTYQAPQPHQQQPQPCTHHYHHHHQQEQTVDAGMWDEGAQLIGVAMHGAEAAMAPEDHPAPADTGPGSGDAPNKMVQQQQQQQQELRDHQDLQCAAAAIAAVAAAAAPDDMVLEGGLPDNRMMGAAGASLGEVPPVKADRPEALVNAKLAGLTSNLVPYLRRLRVLSLDHVPRRCLVAAGELVAAATGVTELRVGRADTPDQPEEPPQAQQQPPQPQPGPDVGNAGGFLAHMHNHQQEFLEQALHAVQANLLANHHLLAAHAQGLHALDVLIAPLLEQPNPEHGDFGLAELLGQGQHGDGNGNGNGGNGGGAGGGQPMNDMEDGGGGGAAAPPPAGWPYWAVPLPPQLELAPEQAPQGQGEEQQQEGHQRVVEGEDAALGSAAGAAQDGGQVAGDMLLGQQQGEAGPSNSGARIASEVTFGLSGAVDAVAPAAAEVGVCNGTLLETAAGSAGGAGNTICVTGCAGPSSSRGSDARGALQLHEAEIMDFHVPSAAADTASESVCALISEGLNMDGAAGSALRNTNHNSNGANAGKQEGEMNHDNDKTNANDNAGGGDDGGDFERYGSPVSLAGSRGGGDGSGGLGADDDDEELERGERLFWSRVAGMPELRTLVLKGGQLRAADMAGLVALTGLQELVVNHVINMHPGLACLASVSSLTRLVIEDLQYAGGAIHDEFCGLSRLTGLRSLSFLVVGPLPAEVMAWGALTQLTQLEITNHYDDNLLPCFWTVLPRLPHLRSLNLSNFDINNSLLVALRPCTQLSSLQMGRFNLSAPCHEVLPWVRLLHLGFVDDLQHTEVPLVSVFPLLDDLGLQTRYVLSHDSAQRIPRELLVNNTGGRTLPVTRLHLYDALMSRLVPTTIPGLTCLRLDWNQIDTAVMVSYMSQWGSSLTHLIWCNCDAMHDQGLEALTGALPKLTQLELVRCVGISDGGLAALTALTSLTSLNVASAHELTSAGFAAVVSALSSLERLTLRDMAGLSGVDCTELEGLSRRRDGLLVEVLP